MPGHSQYPVTVCWVNYPEGCVGEVSSLRTEPQEYRSFPQAVGKCSFNALPKHSHSVAADKSLYLPLLLFAHLSSGGKDGTNVLVIIQELEYGKHLNL